MTLLLQLQAGYTALMLAAAFGNPKSLSWLTASKVNLEAKDNLVSGDAL